MHRDVERGGGFVGNDQLRLAGQRHGNHGALAHAAGELVRIGAEPALRLGDLHLAEQFAGNAERGFPWHALVQVDGLGNLLSHRERRVHRRHRFLEDHRDPVAANRPHARRAQLEQVLAIEQDLAGFDAPRRAGDQAEDGQRGHALPRAGLADDGQRLAGGDVERDLVHRRDHAAVGAKTRGQLLHLQDWLRHAGFLEGTGERGSKGSKGIRSPSSSSCPGRPTSARRSGRDGPRPRAARRCSSSPTATMPCTGRGWAARYTAHPRARRA